MDPRTHLPTSASQEPIYIPVADFRVIARNRGRSPSLVTLAENLCQAVNLAQEFCAALVLNGNGTAWVGVEEWLGTLSAGTWQSVSPNQGGFCRWFKICRSGKRHRRHGSRAGV